MKSDWCRSSIVTCDGRLSCHTLPCHAMPCLALHCRPQQRTATWSVCLAVTWHKAPHLALPYPLSLLVQPRLRAHRCVTRLTTLWESAACLRCVVWYVCCCSHLVIGGRDDRVAQRLRLGACERGPNNMALPPAQPASAHGRATANALERGTIGDAPPKCLVAPLALRASRALCRRVRISAVT